MSDIKEKVIMTKTVITEYPNGQTYVASTSWLVKKGIKQTTVKKKTIVKKIVVDENVKSVDAW